jgi:hypothetical protein
MKNTSLLAAVLLAGCAGGQLGRLSGEKSLPKELPTEMQEKFEVREAVEPTPISAQSGLGAAPSVGPTPSPTPKAALVPTAGKKNGAAAKVQPVSAPSPQPSQLSSSKSPASVQPAVFNYPFRKPEKNPIWIGEKQVYEITYFGMAAGDFTLEVLPFKSIASRKVFHARGTAISSKVFSLFYRLNDTIETFFDHDGMFSHRFHLMLDESKQIRNSLELYDSEKSQTFFWNRHNRLEKGYSEVKEFFPMPQFPQDSMSALFFLRTQPLNPGDVVTFPVVNEGKHWEAVVTVVRREMMEAPSGRMRAICLKVDTKYQGMLQKKGDSFIWLTDDERRILLRMEAKVRIGTVLARLKSMEPGQPTP